MNLDLNPEESALVRRHPLFEGLSDTDFARALGAYRARIGAYRAGSALLRAGEPFEAFGLVLAGLVQVSFHGPEGDRMIMAHVTPGASFGESLCYLREESEVFVSAEADSRVLWLDPAGLDSGDPFARALFRRFTGVLARRTLTMNHRIQILSKLTLREKIMAFFSFYGNSDGRPFTVPFKRADMALYLGADRSALSRELARMKAEGLLDYEGSCFRLRSL